MALWATVSGLGSLLERLTDRVLPDRSQINAGQQRMNEEEIKGGPTSILRLWRSFLGWVLALVFAWEVMGRPVVVTYWPHAVLPPSALGEVSRLLLGMLGLGW